MLCTKGGNELSRIVEAFVKTFEQVQRDRISILREIWGLLTSTPVNSTVVSNIPSSTSLSASTSANDMTSSKMMNTGKNLPQLIEQLNATSIINMPEFASRFNIDIRIPANRTQFVY